MKTITVKQPWASLIVEGIKDIENRTWKCPQKYIGKRVLIHAGMKPDNIKLEIEGQASVKEIQMFSALGKAEDDGLFGAIIGSVEIVDCVINYPSIWAEKSYKCTRPGKCGLWNSGGCDVEDGICINHFEFEKPIYNWVLANPIKFPEPIPCKGKLSFWDYPNILAKPEEEGGELYCHCDIPVKEENQVTGDSRFGFYCRYCGGKRN